jgi:hypothetical protein
MTPRKKPTYPLNQIQGAVRVDETFRVTAKAFETAVEVLCDREDVRECVLSLTSRDFHKSMESETVPGSWQDVYKTNHHGFPVYLKLRLTERGAGLVISFKLDENP